MKVQILKNKLIPFKFDAKRYSDSFISINFQSFTSKGNKEFQKIIYCFWTGENLMSENRIRGLQSLINNSGVKVLLITPQNLNEYILSDYPLHKSFPFLSLVHKSDYLRCYFMHHYGGGYSDIKENTSSWLNAFEALENNRDKFALGYSEINYKSVANVSGKLGKDLKANYFRLIGNCAYILQPYTDFTSEWYTELHKRLDLRYPSLKENPGNAYGDNPGYPIEWTEILGDIFHPLALKYQSKTILNNTIKPSFKNYR